MTYPKHEIAIIGCGYLGAVLATVFAEQGNNVIGLDVDQGKVEKLNQGIAPFFEPEFDELIAAGISAGNLKFTTDPSAISTSDLVFICVGTPQLEGSTAADLRQIWSAIELIAPHLHSDALVVGRSTVPVGTAKEIETRLQILTSTNSTIAWNPEFLREGFAVRDTRTPDRIVIGVQNSDDEQKLKSVYAPQLSKDIPLLVVDLATAELVKVSANAYLATKISFINAMSEIADKTGADVVALADAIGLDPRIGRKFLGAGVGFGGGCLPKDIRAFIHRAGELGLSSSLQFLKEVDEINLRQRDRVFSIAKDLLNGYVKGKRITVLGAAFKPDSDDVRDSPALDIAVRLNSEGANVVVHDPKALENAAKRFPVLTYEGDLEKALLNAELVLHLTEWMQYREIDPVSAKKLVRTPQMIDGRNMLNLEAYQAAGWKIVGLGRQPK